MHALSINLSDGHRADWEANGSRLAIYGPMIDGYRLLKVWAELRTTVPAWGTNADAIAEWVAYSRWPGNGQVEQMLASRGVETFTSPEGIAAWLESLMVKADA